jgi:hypothetical protein
MWKVHTGSVNRESTPASGSPAVPRHLQSSIFAELLVPQYFANKFFRSNILQPGVHISFPQLKENKYFIGSTEKISYRPPAEFRKPRKPRKPVWPRSPPR